MPTKPDLEKIRAMTSPLEQTSGRGRHSAQYMIDLKARLLKFLEDGPVVTESSYVGIIHELAPVIGSQERGLTETLRKLEANGEIYVIRSRVVEGKSVKIAPIEFGLHRHRPYELKKESMTAMEKILDLVKDGPWENYGPEFNEDLAEQLQVSHRTISKNVRRLIELGKITKTKTLELPAWKHTGSGGPSHRGRFRFLIESV